MASPKNLLVAALVASVLGLGVLAWKQHLALGELEAAQAAWLKNERPALQKKLATAEAANALLERDRLAGRESTSPAIKGPPQLDPNGPGDRRRGPDGPMVGPLDNPQLQQLMASQQRSGLDSRYAALFKTLKLDPTTLEKLKSLLIDKQNVPMDVGGAARAAGLNPRDNPEEFSKLMRSSQAELEATIKSTIGDAAYNQYTAYEKTEAQRMIANQLSQRLSYSDTPLTETQSEQLIRILSENAPPPATALSGTQNTSVRVVTAGSGFSFFNSNAAGPVITNAAITQASGILAPAQLQALTEIQQQQQAQAAIMEALRAQRGTGLIPPVAPVTPPSGGKPPGGG